MHTSAIPSPWEEGSDSGSDAVGRVDVVVNHQPIECPRPTASLNFTQFYPSIDTPPTLHALCIGRYNNNNNKHGLASHQRVVAELLAQHLPLVVDLGHDTLQCLPPSATAALVAIARRTNSLTNRVLSALTDPRWEALDLAFTPLLSDRCEHTHAR